MAKLPVTVPRDAIEPFCVRHHIRKLSLFGSILTEHFGEKSDIDMLVEFDAGHVPGFFGLAENAGFMYFAQQTLPRDAVCGLRPLMRR